jgi:hypothetical protein
MVHLQDKFPPFLGRSYCSKTEATATGSPIYSTPKEPSSATTLCDFVASSLPRWTSLIRSRSSCLTVLEDSKNRSCIRDLRLYRFSNAAFAHFKLDLTIQGDIRYLERLLRRHSGVETQICEQPNRRSNNPNL